MKTDNNYFTFLGQRYEGSWETAYKVYELSKEYPTFAEYLRYEGKPIKTDLKEFISTAEKEFLENRLRINGYNITQTANELNITRVGLTIKIKALQIDMPGHKINYNKN